MKDANADAAYFTKGEAMKTRRRGLDSSLLGFFLLLRLAYTYYSQPYILELVCDFLVSEGNDTLLSALTVLTLRIPLLYDDDAIMFMLLMGAGSKNRG